MSDFELISSDDELQTYSYEFDKCKIINKISIIEKNIKNNEIKINNEINILTKRLDIIEKPFSEKFNLFLDNFQNYFLNCFK